MSKFTLASNEDLYKYLVWLGDRFKAKGKPDTASEILMTTNFAIGSQTEFLGEARKLLISLSGELDAVLTKAEQIDLEQVVNQINMAFGKIGGG